MELRLRCERGAWRERARGSAYEGDGVNGGEVDQHEPGSDLFVCPGPLSGLVHHPLKHVVLIEGLKRELMCGMGYGVWHLQAAPVHLLAASAAGLSVCRRRASARQWPWR